MNNLNSNKMVLVVAVIAFMIGSFSLYSMGEMFNNLAEDPYKLPHTYNVAGTLDGVACTGDGKSEYTSESDACRLYSFAFSVEDGMGNRESIKFGIIFDLNDRPFSNLYREDWPVTIDGKSVEVWNYSSDGIDYKFFIAEKCRVVKIDLVAPSFNLTGTIVR